MVQRETAVRGLEGAICHPPVPAPGKGVAPLCRCATAARPHIVVQCPITAAEAILVIRMHGRRSLYGGYPLCLRPRACRGMRTARPIVWLRRGFSLNPVCGGWGIESTWFGGPIAIPKGQSTAVCWLKIRNGLHDSAEPTCAACLAQIQWRRRADCGDSTPVR